MRRRVPAALAVLLLVLSCLWAGRPMAAARTPAPSIPVEIALSGARPAAPETYRVTMTPDDPANPMPSGSAGGVYTVSITGEGSARLPMPDYRQAGEYRHTVRQQPGSDPRCVYDDTVYSLQVIVRAQSGGGLKVFTIVTDGEGLKPNGFHFTNRYRPEEGGGSGETGGTPAKTLTVRVEWVNNGFEGQPDSVTVELLKNGRPVPGKTAVLSADNQWMYAWGDLDAGEDWSVRELGVPEGYLISYGPEIDGVITITNTYLAAPPEERERLTVRKVWAGDGPHPDSVTVDLVRDGAWAASVLLDQGNGWSHTWSELEPGHTWSAVESGVPAGYTPAYETAGNVITITNTRAAPKPPLTLAVEKVWSDRDESGRPAEVWVQLRSGDTVAGTVALSEANGWRYVWDGLDGSGSWHVTEIDVPRGYTPSYHAEDGTVVITNTATLIQTGQLNWPIWVLVILGLLFLLMGWRAVRKEREDDE